VAISTAIQTSPVRLPRPLTGSRNDFLCFSADRGKVEAAARELAEALSWGEEGVERPNLILD